VISPAEKVCQLIGDEDRALGQPTSNRTYSRFGLSNTDLGASFEHHGKLWFLFGDSFPSGGDAANPFCGDAIAWTVDPSPNGCIGLDFVTYPDAGFRSPAVPTIDLGCLDVPLHGVSTGSSMYVWFSTASMTASVLARSDDDANHFTLVGPVSNCQCDPSFVNCGNPSCHFVNVSASIVPDAQAAGLPGSGDRLVLFGSGEYRRSNVYLAVVSLSQIEDVSALRYFAGTDPSSSAPRWSDRESDAAPLFDTTGDNGGVGPCVGELSVQYDPALGRWLALYNCLYADEVLRKGATIVAARIARSPWGAWSDASTLFETKSAYCKYIFEADAGCPQLEDRPVPPPGRTGATYGPYAIPRYSTTTAGGARIMFTMSTGNPYTAMLMTAELQSGP
jgi:hypothetical protein